MKTQWLHFKVVFAAAATFLASVCLPSISSAQISAPLDITASQPIYNSDGAALLPGSNPFAASFGYPVVAGCLVQIIDAGSNATADPLDHNGNPTSDDTVVATTTIGAGIAPDVTFSGRFSTSVYPSPASGSRVYVRVFNGLTTSAATCYGQSLLFTVSGATVLDVSALGLTATLQPRDTINGMTVTQTGTYVIGSNGLASTLIITNGGVLTSSTSIIGNSAAASSNTVWVTGAGSIWNNSGNLTVGNTGSFNSLWVGIGGQVLASSNVIIGAGVGSSNNAINLTGGDLSVTNSNGDGLLEVRNGALTVNAGTVTVDRLVSTNGVNSTVDVNGGVLMAPLVLNAGLFTMTGGTLTVAGAFTNAVGGVFNLSGGNVIVPLQMNNMGVFTQSGGFFDPEVFINSGSFVLSGGTNAADIFLNLIFGTVQQTGGEHDVNVATNVGSWTISGGVANLTNLVIDGGGVFTNTGGMLFSTNVAGVGGVDVLNGTLTLNSGTTTVDRFYATNFASSVVNFNGGTLNSGGSAVNNGSIFQAGDGTSAGTLHLLGGTHNFANGLFINTNALLTGTGAINGVITNAGSIAPGDSAGILTGSGDLTLVGNSLLQMQLAGTNAWLYDQFNLTGAFSFGGALTVSLLDGFTPVAGDRFDLFDFSSSSGSFSLTNLPGLAPTLYWNTDGLYTIGEIEADLMTGALQVTIAPPPAVSAGAQWQVDADGNWHNSGDTVVGLVIGAHTVSYTNVAGWIKPTNHIVQVAFTQSTITQGVYQLAPLLTGVVSRKTHGSAGIFDLNLTLDSSAYPTIEPRFGGPTQLIFTFNKSIMVADGALSANEFTLTNATYSSAFISASNLTLNLTNVVDQSKVTVVLNGISDIAGNVLVGTNAVKIRSLYGDANQNGTVTIGDMQVEKNNLGRTLTTTNFLCDLNLTGTITIGDMQVGKNNLSHTVSLASLTLAQPPQLSAAPTLPAATLGDALGAPELVWSTDGDNVWTPTVASDGSSAARSGSIGDLNVSWVETTVTGPGTISFDWKVSSELNGDYLTFSVDGMDQPGHISGEVDWQTLTFTIPSGAHRLTWTYAKNGASAAGLDAGWLRRVVYTRSP